MKPTAPRPWMIAETNWKHVRRTKYEVAMITMGATEAHNWHLPYGTDSFQNEAIAAEAGRIAWQAGAKVAILPNIPFGVQTGQLDIPFCINMNPSTQLRLLDDVISSLEGVGVPKFVVMNGHGGNEFKQMLRELQACHPKVFLSTLNWYQAHTGAGIIDEIGDHADERETSLLMHLHPHLVLPKKEWGKGITNAWKLKAMREKWAWAQRDWLKATNDTGSGDPAKSTAEKGAKYLAAIAERVASYLVELARIKVTELYEKPKR
jgi:creatinine amidohydrolase